MKSLLKPYQVQGRGGGCSKIQAALSGVRRGEGGLERMKNGERERMGRW